MELGGGTRLKPIQTFKSIIIATPAGEARFRKNSKTGVNSGSSAQLNLLCELLERHACTIRMVELQSRWDPPVLAEKWMVFRQLSI